MDTLSLRTWRLGQIVRCGEAYDARADDDGVRGGHVEATMIVKTDARKNETYHLIVDWMNGNIADEKNLT
jgi:hypothetical protein